MTGNKNIFANYPDSMTLRDVANALGISTKLASRLVREGSIYGVKVGREYRVAKTTVMEYIMDRRTPGGYKKCVGSVTSNTKGWTCDKKSDMLCFAKAKEVC